MSGMQEDTEPRRSPLIARGSDPNAHVGDQTCVRSGIEM